MERDHLQDVDVDGTYNIKMDLKEMRGMASTGLIWLRIAAGGGRL
jgi:hypothetical protein